jgi:uncharacterized protein (DUF2141 family)
MTSLAQILGWGDRRARPLRRNGTRHGKVMVMTRRIVTITALLGAGLVGQVVAAPAQPVAPPATAPTGARIVATVGKLRNHQGSVQCSLHATGKGFPGGKPVAIASVTRLAGTSAVCTFSAVPPGTYAIAVLHDENNNGKLDTNWLGIPEEGYGASNNNLHTFSAPGFEESSFVVRKADVALAIRVKY